MARLFDNQTQPQKLLANGLIVYLFFVFLVGGASRWDVMSLPLLRPVAVFVCGLALLTINRDIIRGHRFLLGMALAIFLLTALHLVPLPPSLWQALPGRQIVVAVEDYAGLSDVWRPLTLTPTHGWNALYALFVPLAALLLAVQLDRAMLERLVRPLLAIGLFSAVLGILQASGDPKGAAYLYRITNSGSSVGLFANRNHQAFLLLIMFPLLALWAADAKKSEEDRKLRLFGAAIASLILVPLLLVTGSRAGALLLFPAVLIALMIYTRPKTLNVRHRARQRDYVMPVVAFVGVILLLVVVGLASRAESLQRLFGDGDGDVGRSESWPIILRIIQDFLPFGSGSGSFVETYYLYEPDNQLDPSYLNHAHNDWLEVAMTFGVPGMLLLGVATFAVFVSVARILRQTDKASSEGRLGRAGAATVVLLGLASIPDYPLRTPSLACLFVVACVWMHRSLDLAVKKTGNARAD